MSLHILYIWTTNTRNLCAFVTKGSRCLSRWLVRPTFRTNEKENSACFAKSILVEHLALSKVLLLESFFHFYNSSSLFIVKVLSRKGKKSFSLKPSLLTIFSFPSFALSLEPHSQRKIKLSHLEQGGESPLFLLPVSVSEGGRHVYHQKEDRPIENWFFPVFFLFPGILFIQNVIWNNLSLLIFCKYNFGYLIPLQHYWEDKALCLRPEMHLTEGLLR